MHISDNVEFFKQFQAQNVVELLESGLDLDKSKDNKILHVGTGNLFGGVENIMISIAKNSQKKAANHAFAYCFNGQFSKELKESSAETVFFPAYKYRNPISLFNTNRCLYKIVNDRDFNAVIFYSSWTYSALSWGLRSNSRKIALWAMNYLDTGLTDKFLKLNQPDYLFACSNDVLNSFNKFFKPISKKTIYPPVNSASRHLAPDEIQNLKNSVGGDLESKIILMVGRLDPYKGHDVLIRALGELNKNNHKSKWQAWLVGGVQRPMEYRYLEDLKNIAIKSGIQDKILWLGQRKDVSRLMQCADVFCHPNTGPEPFGVVFIEAQLAGCPVVTTNMGGAREAVASAPNNILIDKPCPLLLAKALKKVLSGN